MVDSWSPRDLSQKIRELASSHPAYSMVYKPISVCCDHLDCIARSNEANQEIAALQRQLRKD